MNFKVIFLYVFLVLFALQIIFHSKLYLALNALMITVLLVPIYQYLIPIKNSTESNNILKVCSTNLELINTDITSLENMIADENPDVLLLMEVTNSWMAKLKTSLISNLYPHRIEYPQDGYFGIVLYSKYKLSNAEIIKSGKYQLASIKADISTNSKKITILGTHPPPAISKEHFKLRNEQYKQLKEIVQKTNNPIILMGDFNSTTHSAVLQQFFKNTSLKDSRYGFGLQPSWSIYNKSILPLAIDHIFVSESLPVINRYVGPAINSDHKPIFAHIGIN